jgi:hypothetical protein
MRELRSITPGQTPGYQLDYDALCTRWILGEVVGAPLCFCLQPANAGVCCLGRRR